MNSITPRQQDIILQLRQGRTNRQISAALGIQHATVKNHVFRLCRKFGVRDRVALALCFASGIQPEWFTRLKHELQEHNAALEALTAQCEAALKARALELSEPMD